MKNPETAIVHIGPAEQEEQVHERPAVSNFGQFLQELTERYAERTKTDLGTVEWQEYPIDRMISDALMAIVAKLSKTHGLKISTQKKIEAILPRLSYQLELGIAINGGPEAVAEKFEQEVVPQIEAEIAKLAEGEEKNPQKLWQLPVAKLLVGLIGEVKQRASVLAPQVDEVKRVNIHDDYESGWVDLDTGLSHREAVRHALDWTDNPFQAPKGLGAADYLDYGEEWVKQDQLKQSAARKMIELTPGMYDLPEKVQAQSIAANLFDRILVTQFAAFIAGKKHVAYLSKGELDQVIEKVRQRDDIEGLTREFKSHLREHFGLTQAEIEAAQRDMNFVKVELEGDAEEGLRPGYNSILFHPLEGKQVQREIAGLREHYGVTEGEAVRTMEDAVFLKRHLGIELEGYRKKDQGALEILMESLSRCTESEAAHVAFIDEFLRPEDKQKAFSTLAPMVTTDLARKMLEEHGVLKQLTSGEMMLERMMDIFEIHDGMYDRKRIKAWEGVMEMAGQLGDDELEDTVVSAKATFFRFIVNENERISEFDWRPIRDRISPDLWFKLALGSLLVFREGEFKCPEGDNLESYALPWSEQAQGVDFSRDEYMLKLLDLPKDDLEKLMEEYSEEEIFYFVHEGEEHVDRQWKEFAGNRKSFFEMIGRMKKKAAAEKKKVTKKKVTKKKAAKKKTTK